MDGNPAIINVYRKRTDLPPPGAGPGGYTYNSPHANRRPVIIGLQDQVGIRFRVHERVVEIHQGVGLVAAGHQSGEQESCDSRAPH